MANGRKETAFERAMSNGLLATVAWFILLILYVTFRGFKIEAPGLDLAFQVLTGGWVAMLTLAQSRKNLKTEEEVKELKQTVKDEVVRADKSETRANESETRADASEKREKEWSLHQDHVNGDDDAS
jgi:hypothetical protein